MVPHAHTLIFVEEELPGAQAWAKRRSVPIVWIPAQLELRMTLSQPETKELFHLRGQLDNYREVPPAWVFTDETWKAEPRLQLYPKPASQSPYGASVFHTKPVICAPFNRLAYKEHEGPHADWGGPASWLTAGRPTEVKALCLGDMLSVIYEHFLFSRGRMA